VHDDDDDDDDDDDVVLVEVSVISPADSVRYQLP
jgi:hypothetical protein